MAQVQTVQVDKHAVPVAVNEVGYDHDGETFLVYTPQTHCRNCSKREAVNAERLKGGSIILR